LIIAQDKTGFYGLSTDRTRPKKSRKFKQSSKGARILLVGMVLFSFALCIMATYYQARVFKLGYQITSLQQELALLRVENHDLDERVQELASLERVETLAINKLGMVKPDSSNVLMLAMETGTEPPAGAGTVDETAGSPLTGDSGSLLVRAFNELVNRLGNKTWTGHTIGAGFKGVTYADNEALNPEKNNGSLSANWWSLSIINNSIGLAAAC
jgi:cell division protein FtsL